MDVSIKSTDKQAREANGKARKDKQARKDQRALEYEKRSEAKIYALIERRLRRKISKEVRGDLRTEKRRYVKGYATGGEYTIDTRVKYRGSTWWSKLVIVEEILRSVLAEHSGFTSKVEYHTDYGEDPACYSIGISYTLLED